MGYTEEGATRQRVGRIVTFDGLGPGYDTAGLFVESEQRHRGGIGWCWCVGMAGSTEHDRAAHRLRSQLPPLAEG